MHLNRGAIRVILVLVMTLAWSGCGRQEEKPVARPGFTPIPVPGAAAKFFLEDKSVRREGEVINFMLLTELEKGEYLLQAMRLDGKGGYQRLAGGRYRKDGTLAAMVPAEPDWQRVEKDPEMAAVAQAVGARVPESRAIVGEIDAAKAMDLIFGNFDAARGTSRWRINLPPALGENDFFPPGEEGLATKALAQLFEEGGTIKYLLITQSRPAEETFECHACAPLLSGFIFAFREGKWLVEMEDRYISFAGIYGEAPEGKLLQLGKDRFGVIFEGGDTAQGYTSRYAFILAPVGGKLRTVAELDLGGDNTGACPLGKKDKNYWGYTGQYEFMPTDERPFYDLKLVTRGTRGGLRGKKLSANGEKYFVFEGERYVERPRGH